MEAATTEVAPTKVGTPHNTLVVAGTAPEGTTTAPPVVATAQETTEAPDTAAVADTTSLDTKGTADTRLQATVSPDKLISHPSRGVIKVLDKLASRHFIN